MNLHKRTILWDHKRIPRDEFIEKYRDNKAMMERIEKTDEFLVRCYRENWCCDLCNNCAAYYICVAEE